MSLQKKLLREGNKTDYPKRGDKVTIEYTGWLYDAGKADNQYRGDKYVQSHRLPLAWLTTITDSTAL